VDKHSTGGLGDKVSLILAPLLAACGFHVPMISGRGLGLTGGTLDKLESIPGLRTDLSEREMNQALDAAGCFIAGASEQIAPADRKLYALRDVTGTVESVPLITASILSKKLAEDLDSLVMDVKTGSGAFMKNERDATELAESIVRVGIQAGVPTTAILSDMDQPLGESVGNAIEVEEARDVLIGQRGVTADLTIELGCELIVATGSASTRDQAKQRLLAAIDDGTAMERFEKMISLQGGRLPETFALATATVVEAETSGTIESFNCATIGETIIELGGGRRKQGDSIDHRVGIRVHGRIGKRVEKGDPLMTLYCDLPDVEGYREKLKQVVVVGERPIAPRPLVLKRISAT
jgi:pyrimidine-nucleoside phosphorylase